MLLLLSLTTLSALLPGSDCAPSSCSSLAGREGAVEGVGEGAGEAGGDCPRAGRLAAFGILRCRAVCAEGRRTAEAQAHKHMQQQDDTSAGMLRAPCGMLPIP